jgi:hypothetical protein
LHAIRIDRDGRANARRDGTCACPSSAPASAWKVETRRNRIGSMLGPCQKQGARRACMRCSCTRPRRLRATASLSLSVAQKQRCVQTAAEQYHDARTKRRRALPLGRRQLTCPTGPGQTSRVWESTTRSTRLDREREYRSVGVCRPGPSESCVQHRTPPGLVCLGVGSEWRKKPGTANRSRSPGHGVDLACLGLFLRSPSAHGPRHGSAVAIASGASS